MVQGCTSGKAVNFNSLATADNGNCVFLFKRGDDCLMFKDVAADKLEDRSFTLSWSMINGTWVFFHDYMPSFYFHTRDQLWATYNQEIYKMNKGPYGQYFTDEIKPFFIDVAFAAGTDILLQTVEWISEMIAGNVDNRDVENEWATLTHITIWNSSQHTGRLELATLLEAYRKTKGTWSFNDFKNILKDRGTQFLENIFRDYALLPNVTAEKDWWEEELIQDKYLIVRFEFDNLNNNQLILHNLGIEAIKSDR